MKILAEFDLIFQHLPCATAMLNPGQTEVVRWSSEGLVAGATHKLLIFQSKTKPEHFSLAVPLEWSDQKLNDWLAVDRPYFMTPQLNPPPE